MIQNRDSDDRVRTIQQDFGTPVFVYSQVALEAAAAEALGFPNAYGLTARYAIKALPTAAILRILDAAGMHMDASSGFEAHRALNAGIAPERIQITAQELPKDLEELVERGVLFNACSLNQLRAYGRLFPGREVSVRINPGLGTGHNNRTNVGGPSSSFGIWHEYVDDVLTIQREFGLKLTRMHTHIGSGGDPETWKKCARMSLDIAARLPETTRISLGGGFKVGRMPGEESARLDEIGNALRGDFEAFHDQHGRKLHLEIEPGTFIAANAGAIVATVIDVVDTGTQGYAFIKVDSGMTECLRPSHYGAQQPIAIVSADRLPLGAERPFLVVGHCCESGDILTPEPGNPEGLGPITLPEPRIGDVLVIGGAGAYCASMASKNYNAFPEAAEVLITNDGTLKLIRERQTLEQITANEIL